MRNRAITRFLLVFLLTFAANLAAALNLDRLFPQPLEDDFFSDLKSHTGNERAVFVELAGVEKTFYLRHTGEHFLFHSSLSEAEEKLLQPQIFAGKKTLFSPLKQNGEPLYEKGAACISDWQSDEESQWQFLYVPFNVAEKNNDAFVSDLGYLQITIDAAYLRSKREFEAILKSLFGRNAKICRQVRLNRYYLYRDNYYGPVEFIQDRTSENIIFPPVHKATLNKSISDWHDKTEKDRDLVINLIARERYLYSQDMRLKMGMVPGFVKISWEHIDNTDIGSGQNHLIFLSSGAGINYFDDQWKQARQNVPCPRMYFHPELANLERIQLYPTYSIEPKEKGTGRLLAINLFQNSARHPADMTTEVIWSTTDFKARILPAIEDSLCQYGLTNDSPDLESGFVFKRCFFNGNPVNNEIRVYESVAVRDYLTSVIVPVGSAETYCRSYMNELANTCQHWEYNCGIHFSRLFIEAAASNDKGFRITWLMQQLKKSHPALFRLLVRAQFQNSERGLRTIADKVSVLAEKAGRGFFMTPYFDHYRNLDQQRNRLWLDYLEAYRTGDKKTALKLFTEYVNFYQHLEAICK